MTRTSRYQVLMPDKPIKMGLKVHALADAGTGYCLNLLPHSGAEQLTSGRTATVHYVMKVAGPYLNTGRVLFMDRWYSSLSVMNNLMENNTYMTGTIMKNRIPGLPKDAIYQRKNQKERGLWKSAISLWRGVPRTISSSSPPAAPAPATSSSSSIAHDDRLQSNNQAGRLFRRLTGAIDLLGSRLSLELFPAGQRPPAAAAATSTLAATVQVRATAPVTATATASRTTLTFGRSISAEEAEVPITIVSWMDNAPVHVISSACGNQRAETDTSRRVDGIRQDLQRPRMIEQYNRGKAGVDRMDMIRAFSPTHVIWLRRWWLCVFTFTYDVAINNARVTYRRLSGKQPLSSIDFRFGVIEHLEAMSDHCGRIERLQQQLLKTGKRAPGFVTLTSALLESANKVISSGDDFGAFERAVPGGGGGGEDVEDGGDEDTDGDENDDATDGSSLRTRSTSRQEAAAEAAARQAPRKRSLSTLGDDKLVESARKHGMHFEQACSDNQRRRCIVCQYKMKQLGHGYDEASMRTRYNLIILRLSPSRFFDSVSFTHCSTECGNCGMALCSASSASGRTCWIEAHLPDNIDFFRARAASHSTFHGSPATKKQRTETPS